MYIKRVIIGMCNTLPPSKNYSQNFQKNLQLSFQKIDLHVHRVRTFVHTHLYVDDFQGQLVEINTFGPERPFQNFKCQAKNLLHQKQSFHCRYFHNLITYLCVIIFNFCVIINLILLFKKMG